MTVRTFWRSNQRVCNVKDKLFVYRVRARSPALNSFAEQPVLLIPLLIVTTSEELSIGTKKHQKIAPSYGQSREYITRFIPSYMFQGTGLIPAFIRFKIQ